MNTSVKPVRKAVVFITQVLDEQQVIQMYAPAAVAAELGAYGTMKSHDFIDDRYDFIVDPRFDFREVLEYVLGYYEGEGNEQ